MIRWLREHEVVSLLIGWAGLSLWIAVPALSSLDGLGLFYDEAWLAQQARAFVEPTREGLMPPGASSTWLFGRPFPLFALPYLGALKSQLLIPSLALFGVSLETLRTTTLLWGLLALLASMLLGLRLFGLAVGLLTGALIATDPSFVFQVQREWGPFTIGLLCRSLGLALLIGAYATRRRLPWLAGAFILGLGVYNRADFVLILAAAALGLLAFHPQLVATALRERRRDLVTAGLAFTCGALPLLISALDVLRTIGELTTRGDFPQRVHTLARVLDGSHFYRLMEVGGRFEATPAVAGAPFSALPLALGVAAIVVVADGVRRGSASITDGRGALLTTCIALGLAMLALPGATRAHHMLNLMPFVQLLVAVAAVDGYCRISAQRGRTTAGLAMGAACVAVIASAASADLRTRESIARSGGRGWWSDSILELAAEIEAQPGSVVVSLDWGFHLPLLFLTHEPKMIEPIWRIPRSRGGTWSHSGTADHIYLVHDLPYDRFGFGPPFLAAAERLPDATHIREYRDREGTPAFYSVRIPRDHRLVWSGGFKIELD